MTKRTLAAAAVLTTLSGGGLAAAAGEGGPLRLGERNPGTNETRAVSRETELIADNGTYGTRQSNKSSTGGGAIYGCRSTGAAGTRPCVRANNLAKGLAFQFETDGPLAGTITAEGGDAAKPFTTNATGVATGLNADRVDGKGAEDLTKDATSGAVAAYEGRQKLASVAANGALGSKRGATAATREAQGRYTVDFDGKVVDCSQQATPRTAGEPFTVTLEQVDDDTVRVRTFDLSTGASPEDAAFHLSVSC